VCTTADLDIDIIVVDNGSTDGSQAMVQSRFGGVRLIANQSNLGFAKANNQALAATTAPYVLLLNSDAQLRTGTLHALLELAESQPKAANVDSSFQASYAEFPTLWQELLVLSALGRLLHGRWYPSHGPEDGRGPQRVDWVGGACMLVRRRVLADLGGFDEAYFMYAEEMDLCFRAARAGWEVWYVPAADVVHHGGASSRHQAERREADLYCSRVRFFRRHYGDAAAQRLKLLIYTCVATKLPVHALLRGLSGGRYGRPVVGLRLLAAALRRA
jgi:GT2 family glycosyltransferase